MKRPRTLGVFVLVALLATLPVSPAGAGETVTSGEVKLEQWLLPLNGGCQVVWWIVVDDLPDVAQFSVPLRRLSPSPAERTETFDRFSLANSWAGTPFDYPAPAGKLHKPVFQASSTLPCDPSLFHVWEAVSLKVTQFTVDPPVLGKAAIELELVQEGNSCERRPGVPSRGEDRIFGGRGDDRLDGGAGKDLVAGGPGRDRCAGRGDTARGCESGTALWG